MTRLLRWIRAGLPAALLTVFGCSDTDVMNPPPEETIELTLSGFPEFRPFENEGAFELWISFSSLGARRHDAAVSAGKFRTGTGGQPVDLDLQPITFAVDASNPLADQDGDGKVDWQLVADVFITRQAPGATEPQSRFLGASVTNGTGTLTPGHGDALGGVFMNGIASAGGSYLLDTPTTADSTDALRGVWFSLPSGAGASLTLPPPPPDWIYEGWVTLGSAEEASLGRFSVTNRADADSSGPLLGLPPTDSPGYPFPGSDFPFGDASVDLSQGNVTITLEPLDDGSPDTSTFLFLLGAPIPMGYVSDESVPLTNSSSSFPSGTITLPTAQ